MKRDAPLVSVIMNCFNSSEYLQEAIESVYAQTFKSWEIVFWDNQSTDRSAEIAKSYDNRLRYFLAPQHTELGVARNLALQQARGEYIAFLDCDDIFLKDKLKTQLPYMMSNNYEISYGSIIVISQDGRNIKRRRVKNASGNIFGELLRHYEISMLSVIVKRSLLITEGLNFDTQLKYNPDFNLFMKIASRYRCGVIKQPLGKYRLVKGSLSARTVSIAPIEIKYTLDELHTDQALRTRYAQSFKAAYSKLAYYRAVALLYQANRLGALKALWPIITSRVEYFILYILIIFFVPVRIILRVLGR